MQTLKYSGLLLAGVCCLSVSSITLAAQGAIAPGQIAHGQIASITLTVTEVTEDGRTIQTTSHPNAQKYAAQNGIETTYDQCNGGGGSNPGNLPPAGDAYPSQPGPGESNSVLGVGSTLYYGDGWALSSVWSRIRGADGQPTDWRETSRSSVYTPPTGKPNIECPSPF